MVIERRDFVKGSLAALGFTALGGTGLFAAPPGWKPPMAPRLVFGILTDTHLMVEYDGRSLYRTMTFDYVRKAFRLFKSRGIDAFVHLGDAAHRGAVREWEFHRELFEEVFGRSGGPQKIIIVGNHELFGSCGRIKATWPDPADWRNNAICADVKRHYERVWGVPYETFFHREVKGFHFFGRHWVDEDSEYKGTYELPFAEYILSKAGECSLAGADPFFILSHRRHHFRFCHALRDCRNAVAFMGHWHQSNADWKSIYCDRGSFGGFFPHIEVGACRFDGHNGLFRPEEIALPEDSSSFKGTEMPSRQAMVVSVYDRAAVFERYEVDQGGRLGRNWVLPLDWRAAGAERTEEERGRMKHPFATERMKKVCGCPEFPEKAKLAVEAGSKEMTVRVPMADGNPRSRPYAYNVVVVGDDPKVRYFKSEYFSGVNCAVGHEPDGGTTTVRIPWDQIPAGKKLLVAVRPVSPFGTAGKAIGATARRP